MNIAIASLGNPRSVKTWSGIPAHIILALERKGYKVTEITLKKPSEPWYYNWLRSFYWRLFKRWFLADVEPTILKVIGRQFDEQVKQAHPDVVLTIHGDFLAYTSFRYPAIIIHDTTFATLVNYYPEFSNLTARSIRFGNEMYRRSLHKAKAAVFSAAWASNSAIEDYEVPAKKIYTIPFGANLIRDFKKTDVDSWIQERANASECQLLFLGVNWQRKGGPDALRFTIALNELGIKSKLVVAGCTPYIAPEYESIVEKVGFLSKDVPAQVRKLEQLFKQCQALLLPSIAECYGCVYCEANAYGLPALGRDTGGVSEIIKDGKNGLLLKTGETPETFAQRWSLVWNDKEKYRQMALNAKHEYNKRLNYDSFVKQLVPLLYNVQEKRP